MSLDTILGVIDAALTALIVVCAIGAFVAFCFLVGDVLAASIERRRR